MTYVKICGLTHPEDALAAAEAGADFLGFVFYPPSPRYVEPERACQIMEAVRRTFFDVRFVGVFVDEEPETIRRIASRCGLNYAQLHGSESPEMTATLMDWGIKVIKAFRVGDQTSLVEMKRHRAEIYLLDTYVPDQPGGTGHTFDWKLAVQAKEYGPVILAGGLTPDNVARAVRAVQPWGVDVASGVEAVPGRKDHAKLRRFITTVKKGVVSEGTNYAKRE